MTSVLFRLVVEGIAFSLLRNSLRVKTHDLNYVIVSIDSDVVPFLQAS
jgi:hypothetical protein